MIDENSDLDSLELEHEDSGERVVLLDPASLTVHALNAAIYNSRPIDDSDEVELRESIQAVGIIAPLVITEKGLLLSGSRRRRNAMVLKMPLVPCVMRAGISDADAIRLLVFSNQSRPKTSEEKLREFEVLAELAAEEAAAREESEAESSSKTKRPVHNGPTAREKEQIAAQIGISREQVRKGQAVLRRVEQLSGLGRDSEASELKSALGKSVNYAYKIVQDTKRHRHREVYPADASPRGQLDDKGNSVPECLWPVFELRHRFYQISQLVTDASRMCAGLEKEAAGEDIKGCAEQLQALSDTILWGRPSVVVGTKNWKTAGESGEAVKRAKDEPCITGEPADLSFLEQKEMFDE